jgi:hypothetical protein
MKYKEANWDQIKNDLENTLTTINNIYEKSDTNILWNTFKNDIINSIWSAIISSSWWCCFASGFPVMNEGIDQSMLPRLKSPPTHMFEEFVLSKNTKKSNEIQGSKLGSN